jgi:hypothetical protein
VPVTVMSYEEAVHRAALAASFVQHPYWEVVARMLSGTIQAETEQALSSNEHLESNRAAVAHCRKMLQMPFFDMEQGRLAEGEYQKAYAQLARRRGTQSGPAPREVQ